MTGTAVTEAGELWQIYKLDVVEILLTDQWQTDKEDFIYKTTRENSMLCIEDVTALSKAGKTSSYWNNFVEISELLSRMLK
jgi:preprotein translocase subunit SecA